MSLSLKSIGSWAVLSLMMIQFIPLDRINPPVVSDFQTPSSVKNSLKKACYDCHSNETVWSGIAYIAPISWLVSSTVSSGRNVVNFSTWNNEKRELKQADIIKVIAACPLHQRLYYICKPEKQLEPRERKMIIDWLNETTHEQSPML
jgi:hypothetical protein